MSRRLSLLMLTVSLSAVLSPTVMLAKPDATRIAARIDASVAVEVFADNDTQLAPRTDDATFFRRIHLDLLGDIPSPEALIAFVLDPATDKREAAVRRLLDNPLFGQNWARYWRDAILYRRAEDRAVIVSNSLTVYLTEQLNAKTGWDVVAADFITAEGDVREQGATGIIMAQDGRTEETTAEMSRLFLGIQIQCAQCHDHPYDRWKREQFHQLAAFFPRVGVRPVNSPLKRSFAVIANDNQRRKRKNNNGNQPTAEHYMSDLEDPSEPGTLMTPEFFLTGAKLELGSRDANRRSTLATWITGSEWFAIAYVNRMWSELVGEGFYEPVDDIGPDRVATAPRAMRILATAFVESGYDPKWLVRTICATEAYQREARPRRNAEGIPLQANVAQPLRGDQLFNALLTAVERAEPTAERRNKPGGNAYGKQFDARQRFATLFGFDPSDARGEISASVPQVLALMNGPQFAREVNARSPRTMLGRVYRQNPDNRRPGARSVSAVSFPGTRRGRVDHCGGLLRRGRQSPCGRGRSVVGIIKFCRVSLSPLGRIGCTRRGPLRRERVSK